MAQGMHKYSVQEAQNVKLGQGGYDYATGATINQTTNPNTEWVAIQALSAVANVTTISADTDIWDSLTDVDIPVGTTIYGRWTSIAVDGSDFIIAYRG